MANLVVDLLASWLNHQLPQYIAWRPDPFSQGTDAMHQGWSQDYLYTFSLFLPSEQNITECMARKNAKYVVDNINMAQSILVFIPFSNVNRNTSYPSKDKRSSQRSFRKRTSLYHQQNSKVSGMENLRERSSLSGVLRTASSLSLTQGEVHLQEIMNRPGESRLAGVIGDKLIQFRVI